MEQGDSPQQCQLLQSFTLHKTRLIIERDQPFYTLVIDGQNNRENQAQLGPNLLAIGFNLVISQGLNECLKPRAKILEIWMKSLRINVDLLTRDGEYCFEEMNYYMFLQAKSSRHGDCCLVSINSLACTLKRTEIDVTIYLSRDNNPIEEIQHLNSVTIIAGSKKINEHISFQINRFRITSQSNTNKEPLIKGQVQNKFKFIDREYSLPLKVFNHRNELYQSLGIYENCTLQQIEAFIVKIPSYSSPRHESENKLYLCHDMKGGYKEDIYFDNNILANKTRQTTAYRAFHLQQAEIFNYFSHHNITIPPKHWRILCKRYGTRCLGTFITEREDYSEDMLTAKQFALFLIAIAKKCQFDGYLINIERKVSSVTAFKRWVQYLTMKMHEFIPNSTVIWYDSISAKDGVIRYQNALSHQNYDFYHCSDGIFTNYWWNNDSLKQSIQLRGQNKRKVYIGNDCFGRNTYGGGKLDIYKAANSILQFKNHLSIALFAPAFTYETAGDYNRILFHQQENGLYKGIKSQVTFLKEWREKKKEKMSGGWQKQGDWTVSSFGQCERSLVLKFEPLKDGQQMRVIFLCGVTSTPPLFGSHYKIVMQIIDENNSVVMETDSYNFFNYKTTKEEVQLATEQITASYASIGSRNLSIRIIIMAQSKERWSGYFGPRFTGQMVSVLTYEKERHWVTKIPISQLVVGTPFHSYCNAGFGDFFFKQGLKLQPNYSFLADMDVPHTHIINNPLYIDFNYNDVFFGGSSLQVKQETIKLLKLLIPKDTDLKEEYYLQVTVNKTQGINTVCKYMSKNEEDRIFQTKLFALDEINGWKRYTFRLVSTLNKVKEDVRSIVELSSLQWPFNIGEIKLIKDKKQCYNPLKCVLQTSKSMIPTDKYYLNLTIYSNTYQRLYVQIQKVGLFAYFQNGVAHLRNVAIDKCECFDIEIVDTDQCLKPVPLCLRNFNSSAICELIFKGVLQF